MVAGRLFNVSGVTRAMSAEGLRLLFPLAALHAGLWPFLWIIVWSFDLPFAATSLPGHWPRKCSSAHLAAPFWAF